ncbi:aminodeoxychorismate synthase component I [Desulfoscipio gibsoniae]|uniref:aminodeoxychorismate synthase n=1 Tax=Desulfoscipio gibsoniae DSM 7213 TaxID=767817 RepID=R4KGJ2_9FIRM|nr:aminodeoxychorismate synthase component I [Desulfoscipio gibsoniae]AGL01719.1 aminodeoxychorismate synthase, component I [Desulfoscipio gibsoniae DSM 7213]
MPVNLPLYKKLPAQFESLHIFENIKDLPYPFLLDTGMLVNNLGSHSFIGADPFLVMSSKGKHITLIEADKATTLSGLPLEKLKEMLIRFSMPPQNGIFPFNGGAVGFFSYDLGRHFEKIPQKSVDDLNTPDLLLGFYDTVIAVDVRTGEATIISTGLPERGEAALERARTRLKNMENKLLTGPNNSIGNKLFNYNPDKQPELIANFTPDEYRRTVQRAIDYIYAGDIFQVNMTQRFCTTQTVDSWEIYKKLKKINPAPFAAFLSFGSMDIISASPERFIKVDGRRVETCPIKGTRPRGCTPEEDDHLRRELWGSEKDQAELMMIVDLERNDLGRVCEIGSIKVPELFRLEEYATVFHLVSTVEGRLLPDKDITDLLTVSFPGGSITGAPKIRAMEIIEELEPVRRGVYTGSIGYIGFDGRVDLNIVIRTIIATKGNLYFQVGGGITADSDPHKEYLETLDKARALARSLGLEASLGC